MTNKKSPDGNQDSNDSYTNNNVDPIWTSERVQDEALRFFEHYLEEYKKDKFDAFTNLLAEFSELLYAVKQLQEAFHRNAIVSTGAFKNSHKAVELYQQLDNSLKLQGNSFSKRLEKLEKA